MSQYCVICFTEGDSKETAVVPSKWLTVEKNVTKCWWPPFKTSDKIMSAVKRRTDVSPTWKKFPAKVYRSFGKIFNI